jgi:hypothetical protein
MNAVIHSQLSVKKRGGKLADYYDLHDFSDCSKEVESSNLHRLYFHTMWGVKNIVIPIFGHTIINSDGKSINVKDVCENDHILPDYAGKFIPTLSDFIANLAPLDVQTKITNFYKENSGHLGDNPALKKLLLSPLWNTGRIDSLLVTHNSWFIGEILPRIFKDISLPIVDFSISPALLFNNMRYQPWMQNGQDVPPSCHKLIGYRKSQKGNNIKAEMPEENIPAID